MAVGTPVPRRIWTARTTHDDHPAKSNFPDAAAGRGNDSRMAQGCRRSAGTGALLGSLIVEQREGSEMNGLKPTQDAVLVVRVQRDALSIALEVYEKAWVE